jgi:SAM-dependent methyltransferase
VGVEWDYGAAAADYDARPPYADAALAACFDDLAVGVRACDVGAGTGRLTAALAERAFRIVAIEPNPAMRALGAAKHRDDGRAAWIGGQAEALPLAAATCGLVTFGSSFNVVDRRVALVEAARVLAAGGRFACLWNHRDLDDPLQRRIEELIRRRVPVYAYGSRRADQEAVIAASGYFRGIRRHEAAFVQQVPAHQWMRAWRSHLTLRRQAGDRYPEVLAEITALVAPAAGHTIAVPYVTRCWLAERP